MIHAFYGFLVSLVLAAAGAVPADDRLPLALIRLPESVTTVFVAETTTAEFHRFDNSGDSVRYDGAYYMSIGKAGDGKSESGDKRTPLGAYFVTERLDTSKLHEKYGAMAFPLDYPNAWDRRLQRDGDGIWLHGVDPASGRRPKNDTDGCIALGNGDLAALAALIDSNVTPVLVTRAVAWGDPGQNDALSSELQSVIEDWATSQSSGDLHAYLSSYDDGFRRWGMNKSEWAALALQAAPPPSDNEAKVSELLLLRYPEEGDIYFSRFQLQVTKNESDILSNKRLFWRRDAQGMLRIIAEDDG